MESSRLIKRQGLSILFDKSFLIKDEADKIFSFCDNLNWKKTQTGDIFNKRLNITFGEKGLVYNVTFSNKIINRNVIDWSEYPELLTLKTKVEDLTTNTAPNGYNFCAIMRYPNSSTIIKKHKDKEMVSGTSICGISVGATRNFKLSPPTTNYFSDCSPLILSLIHGSLYCLLPPTNDYWCHEILSGTLKSNNVRYSLTFRNVPHAK